MFIPALALYFQTALTPLNHKPMPPESSDFTFIALGDNRPAGAGLPPTRTYRELIEEVSVIGPAFVLSSGDLYYGNEETLDMYKQEEAWMKPLLESLPCPFYNAPGNHEINNRADFLAEYQASTGPLYGSFEYGGIRFVAVCTELPGSKAHVDGAQLDWLKGLLGTKKPTVLFQHHPIFKRPTNPDAKEEAQVADSAVLHALYVAGGAQMVVEGHDHIYDQQTVDGVNYTIAGGAGAPLDGQTKDGGYFHFLLVHVKDGQMTATPVPLGTLEILSQGDGKTFAANYADTDLPISNLRVTSTFEPKAVTASYTTKKGKATDVAVKILKVEKSETGYVATLGLQLPKHRATLVKLAP